MDRLPLLAATDLGATIAWRAGRPVSAGAFVGAAEALAERLPAAGRPVNLCRDRHAFALGFAAALLRGQTSVLPPNALPETLARLAALPGAPLYALVDGDPSPALPLVRVDPGGAPAAPAAAIPHLRADLDAVQLLTSGSTGEPQPHGRSWRSIATSVGAIRQRFVELLGRDPLAGCTIVATVPPQHSFGLESSLLLAFLGGAAFDAGRPFYPADIAAALAAVPRPRALVTTPFHLKTLLAAGVELPAADLLLSATAPLSSRLAGAAEARFGAALVEIYGCTETGQIATRRTRDDEVWTTLGELRLRRDDSGAGDGRTRFLAAGGHVAQPTPLADTLDLVDGRRVRLHGRAHDLIHVAGRRASLGHLNLQLNRIDGVVDGAFWMPEQVADAVVRPVAFVVAPGLDGTAIVAALRERLEAAFVPRRVVHVDALPREPTGKLTASALAAFARETLAAADGQVFDVGADHPAFAGHFPGRPVLPGAALLAFVFDAVAAVPSLQQRLGATPTIEQAKFLLPVAPGTRLRVLLRADAAGIAFDVRAGEHVVARGRVTR